MNGHLMAIVTLCTAMAATAGGIGACSDNKLETTDPGKTGGGGVGGTPGTGAGGRAAVLCGTNAPDALGACVEENRYLKDLTTVEGVRPTGHPHHREIQNLCADRFAEHGFVVERHDYGSGVNVIGVKAGKSEERVLVSAHYDSTSDCPGADDNATGVAGVLETARVLGAQTFERTLVVACWDEEERGLVGSTAYAERAVARGEKVVGHYVYEMIGFFSNKAGSQTLPTGFSLIFPDEAKHIEANESRGDFIAIIGDESFAEGITLLDRYCNIFGVKSVVFTVTAEQKNSALFGDFQRSDHAPFWRQNMPALHMTDTSNFRYEPYHCRNGDDVKENLDNALATRVVSATVAATAELLRLQ